MIGPLWLRFTYNVTPILNTKLRMDTPGRMQHPELLMQLRATLRRWDEVRLPTTN